MSLVHQLHAFHTNALYLVVIAYSAVGSILARLRQTFIMVRFTVDTKEASGTGIPVPIDYALCVLKVQYKSTCVTNFIKFKPSQNNIISCGHLCASQNTAEKFEPPECQKWSLHKRKSRGVVSMARGWSGYL